MARCSASGLCFRSTVSEGDVYLCTSRMESKTSTCMPWSKHKSREMVLFRYIIKNTSSRYTFDFYELAQSKKLMIYMYEYELRIKSGQSWLIDASILNSMTQFFFQIKHTILCGNQNTTNPTLEYRPYFRESTTKGLTQIFHLLHVEIIFQKILPTPDHEIPYCIHLPSFFYFLFLPTNSSSRMAMNTLK